MKAARGGRCSPVVLLAALAAFAGCADGDRPDTASIAVGIFTEDGGEPVAGVKVLLVDAATNRVLAGPVASDEAGRCRLPVPAAAEPRLLVVGGPRWAVIEQPDWYGALVTCRGGLAAAGAPELPTAPLARAAPAVALNRVVVAPRPSPGGWPRFSGTVVDAVTGLPLGQAFVGLSPWPTGYGGGAAVSDDVTGPDGAFVVHDIPLALDDDTGLGFQVLPLLVGREGYRPVRFVHEPPSGIDHPDVSGLVIGLWPLDAAQAGALAGRVVRDGVPVPGVAVALGAVPGGGKGLAGAPGLAAVTGPDGRFRIAGVPPGSWAPQPGFPVGDGAWYPGATAPVAVVAGAEADAGDLAVLHEIEPVPGNPSRLAAADTVATFRWTAAPGAARYGWFLDGELLAESAVESVTVALPGLAAGLHGWQASAVDADGQPVAVMQNDAWFRREAP